MKGNSLSEKNTSNSYSHFVHAVKFFDVKPKPITCMEFNDLLSILAVVRSDHSIELWDVAKSPHIDRVILPQENISIECLTWVGSQLFVGTLQGFVVEFDLLSLKPRFSTPVTSGTCWCLVPNRSNTLLAVGTEVGYINIFNKNDDDLTFEKLLDKQEGQIFCLAWDYSQNFLVSGSVDALRLWNVETGQANFKMTTTRSENKQSTIVWCVCITDDFTIISGDSSGKVCFWDGHMGTAISSYQTHKAGILAMTLSDNQSTLFCAGIDPLIVTFERTNLKSERTAWVKSVRRVIHDHDVKALASAKNHLFSGGVDGYLALSSYLRVDDPPSSFLAQTHANQHCKKILYKYPPLPQPPCAALAAEVRCIMLQYETSIEVWRLGTAQRSQEFKNINQMNIDIKEEPQKLLKLQSVRKQAIRCSAISPNGTFIMYSTDTRFKVFRIESIEKNLKLRKIESLPAECKPSLKMAFSSCSRMFVLATTEGNIIKVRLSKNDKPPKLLSYFEARQNKILPDLISLLAVSSDGKFIVGADRQSNIVVWSEKELHITLPKYEFSPTAMAIHPVSNLLLVVYADHKIIEYDIEAKQITKFTLSFPNDYPKQWTNRCSPVVGVLFDTTHLDSFILYDDSTIAVIKKTKKSSLKELKNKIPRLSISDVSTSDSIHHLVDSSNSPDFTILKKFKHLAFLDWLSTNEMVVVEVSPSSLVEKLPPALKIKRFGKL